MTIRQLITGCLQKLNSKQSGSIDVNTIDKIRAFQKQHPEALLCGSAALILSDMMPYREIHDVDFVINKRHFDQLSYMMAKTNPYDNEEEDGYISYSNMIGSIEFNLLVFDNNIKLKEKTITLPQGDIKCQEINDILYWKRKYNRLKDKEDLENINKAFEEAIFGG